MINAISIKNKTKNSYHFCYKIPIHTLFSSKYFYKFLYFLLKSGFNAIIHHPLVNCLNIIKFKLFKLI